MPQEVAQQRDDNNEALQARLRNACAVLMEHFDSVQIVATRIPEDESTSFFAVGSGNWYSRIASTEEFLVRSKKTFLEK